jgi:hypothetical protein
VTSALAATDRSEFLGRCFAAAVGNRELEHIRDKGADAVLALYRLVKVTLLHSQENDAVLRAIEQSHAALRDFAALAGGKLSITFVDNTVFVCGQLLRAPRAVYESAAELGALLARCGVSEVSMTEELTEAALRDPSKAAALVEQPIAGIALRRVESALARHTRVEDVALEGRFLRLYASALVVLGLFFDRVREGSSVVPHRVKRLAQGFVSLAESGDSGLLGLLPLANAHRDDAGRAVQSAILALALGREITTDRIALVRLVMAAMLADVGRVRLAGPSGRDRLVGLGEAIDAAVPAVTSAVAIATGGVSQESALRAVTMFEALWLEREHALGAPYEATLLPLLQSRILHLVRAVLIRLAPRDASAPMSTLDALQDVARVPSIDLSLLALLLKAVGLTPTGSVVELETGEWAVVVGPSADPDAHERPRVRVVMDRTGRVLDPPREFDLGAPPPGRAFPRITRIVGPEEARFNVARVFVPAET